jgi:hypothetical protein
VTAVANSRRRAGKARIAWELSTRSTDPAIATPTTPVRTAFIHPSGQRSPINPIRIIEVDAAIPKVIM